MAEDLSDPTHYDYAQHYDGAAGKWGHSWVCIREDCPEHPCADLNCDGRC